MIFDATEMVNAKTSRSIPRIPDSLWRYSMPYNAAFLIPKFNGYGGATVLSYSAIVERGQAWVNRLALALRRRSAADRKFVRRCLRG